MKNTLSFLAAFTLATSVMAGGEVEDRGPVESFDEIAPPIADQTVVGNQDPQELVLGTTPAGIPVTEVAHIACKDKLGLSDDNIARFMDALAGGSVYNTGPIDAMGTLFSPNRWADYYTCVEEFK
ncbi:MAG: hypothetical protein DSZ18_01760 [Candidatus Thioglobus sp.]|nr:MAG: hypothetical protein DSZ13_01130 [Candidatus Thioglobus sp.]RUM84185.1 MAG: hypothetical protein DSZ18_01760 [Candidatus Thioglobus sp.]